MCRFRSRSMFLVSLLGVMILMPTPAFAQVYLGLYAGGVIPHDAETEETLTGAEINLSDTEFDAGAMVGGRIGYWFEAFDAPYVGLEAEVYGGFPKISDQNVTIGSVTVPIQEADFDMVTIGFNGLLRYPYGPIQPYAGAGIGILNVDVEKITTAAPVTLSVPGFLVTFPAGSTFLSGDSDTAAALQVMGGVKGFITDNIAIFGEYKWVLSELEFEDVELDYNASHIYGGLEFHFGPGVAEKR